MSDSNVFRFEVFCTSKQLGNALAALSGLVMQVSTPQTAPQAKAANGSVQLSHGDLIEMFLEWTARKKISEISAPVMREFLQAQGRSPNSQSYMFTKLRELGRIKHIGKSTHDSRWLITGAKRSKAKRAAPKRKPGRASVAAS